MLTTDGWGGGSGAHRQSNGVERWLLTAYLGGGDKGQIDNKIKGGGC